jgi:hypothetical protein
LDEDGERLRCLLPSDDNVGTKFQGDLVAREGSISVALPARMVPEAPSDAEGNRGLTSGGEPSVATFASPLGNPWDEGAVLYDLSMTTDGVVNAVLGAEKAVRGPAWPAEECAETPGWSMLSGLALSPTISNDPWAPAAAQTNTTGTGW